MTKKNHQMILRNDAHSNAVQQLRLRKSSRNKIHRGFSEGFPFARPAEVSWKDDRLIQHSSIEEDDEPLVFKRHKSKEAPRDSDVAFLEIFTRHKKRLFSRQNYCELARNPSSLLSAVSDISHDVLKCILKDFQHSSKFLGFPSTLLEEMEKLLELTYAELKKLETAKKCLHDFVEKCNGTETEYQRLFARVSDFLSGTSDKRHLLKEIPRNLIVDGWCEIERSLSSLDSVKDLVFFELQSLQIIEDGYFRAFKQFSGLKMWSEDGDLVSEEEFQNVLRNLLEKFKEIVRQVQTEDVANIVKCFSSTSNALERLRVLNDLLEPTLLRHEKALVIINGLVEQPVFNHQELQNLCEAFEETMAEIQAPIAAVQTKLLNSLTVSDTVQYPCGDEKTLEIL